MPLYPFKCSGCGLEFEKNCSMNEAPLKTKCLKCNKTAHRDWNAYGKTDSQMIDYSFESNNGTRLYPCAVLPNQVDEAKKRHPGTEFRMHNGAYLPVIRNRTHKLRFLKEQNFCELD